MVERYKRKWGDNARFKNGKEDTQFKKGNKGGRPKGVPNKYSGFLRDDILTAAARAGFDKNGKDGFIGYLYMCACEYPVEYLKVIVKTMPHQLQVAASVEHTVAPALEMSSLATKSLLELIALYKDVVGQTPAPAFPGPVTIEGTAEEIVVGEANVEEVVIETETKAA